MFEALGFILLMKPLNEWWLNFLLFVPQREIDASIWAPLWFLVRTVVFFGVTLDFPPFSTKNKTKQSTNGSCQVLSLQVEWLLLQACWNSKSLLGNHLYAFPTALYLKVSGEIWGPEVGVEHLIGIPHCGTAGYLCEDWLAEGGI